jgi:hypothetical protein
MRPTDWSPLADGDPVPGDPPTIRELASHLQGVADNIRTQVQRMNQLDASEIWVSEAATSYAEMQEALPPDLELAATRYESVANALETWEGKLTSAQGEADAALEKAKTAQADIDAANAGIERMEEWEQTAQDTADRANEADPDAPEVPPEPWTGPDHHAQLEDAQRRLREAREALEDACSDRDDAADVCEDAIGEASNDDLENPGWFENFLLAAADVLSIAGAVLGVLSIFFPVLAPLALIVGGAALLLNVGLAAAGSKGWEDAMWDAIGLATFGAGRLLGAGSRLLRARPAAQAMRTAAANGRSMRAPLAAARGTRNSLAARTSLTGLRATNAQGRTIYGAAARSRLLSQANRQVDTLDAARRANATTYRNAMTQYNAIRNPASPQWTTWGNAHRYAGQNAANAFRPVNPLRDYGVGLTGQLIENGGTFGVGGYQVSGAIGNMGDAAHWGHEQQHYPQIPESVAPG